MSTLHTRREPYQISSRFYRALQAKALTLEIDALRDELIAASIAHPDQLRRQRLLIQAQRDEADRFRDFLTAVTVRPATQPAAANPVANRCSKL
jgi:hypothetical protein